MMLCLLGILIGFLSEKQNNLFLSETSWKKYTLSRNISLFVALQMLQLTVLSTFKNGNFHKIKVVVSDMGSGLKSFV